MSSCRRRQKRRTVAAVSAARVHQRNQYNNACARRAHRSLLRCCTCTRTPSAYTNGRTHARTHKPTIILMACLAEIDRANALHVCDLSVSIYNSTIALCTHRTQLLMCVCVCVFGGNVVWRTTRRHARVAFRIDDVNVRCDETHNRVCVRQGLWAHSLRPAKVRAHNQYVVFLIIECVCSVFAHVFVCGEREGNAGKSRATPNTVRK